MFAEVDTVGNSPLDKRLKAYFIAWVDFITASGQEWLGGLPPTALGWKVADRARFNQLLTGLSDRADQAHIGTVDGRKIASIVMTKPMQGDIYIVKLMQRRPGSDDPPGLDHVDFLLPESIEETAKLLDKAKIHYTPQANELHHWLSLRFGEDGRYEAKLLDHLVLEVGVAELQFAAKQIIDHLNF